MSANQDQDPAANRKRGATAEKVSALGKSETPVKPSRKSQDSQDEAKKARTRPRKKTAAKKPSAPSAPKQKAAPATPNGAGAPAPHPNLEKFVRLDIEAIADNMAQLVDQGRKALAAAIGGVNPDEARSELAANVADATKTSWRRRRILAVEARARRRRPGRSLQGVERNLAADASPLRRGGRRPDRSLGSRRQALLRARMEREPLLRLAAAILSARVALGGRHGRERRGSRPADEGQGGLLYAADFERDLAIQFRADQSRNCCARRSTPRARIWFAA